LWSNIWEAAWTWMRSCKCVCDLSSLFVLIASTDSYWFAEEIFPLEGDGSHIEEVAERIAPIRRSTARLLPIAAFYRLTNDEGGR
jgi:hypothetical protein